MQEKLEKKLTFCSAAPSGDKALIVVFVVNEVSSLGHAYNINILKNKQTNNNKDILVYEEVSNEIDYNTV